MEGHLTYYINMALQKEHTLENGISGNYWKIIGQSSNTANGTGIIHYGLIVDSEFRSSLGQNINIDKYIYINSYVLEGVEFWEAFAKAATTPMVALCYEVLKNKVALFSDAIDI